MDFYNYDLDKEIDKIKNTLYKPYDLDFYSARKIIQEILDIPSKINIKAYVYHGIHVSPHEEKDYALLYKEPVLLNNIDELKYLIEKGADKGKTFCFGSSFVRYKELKNIKQDENAKGTIVFPYHSCTVMDTNVDWDEYAEKLLELPDEFKPINICMYYNDLLKNRHIPFIKKGFNVYTAGHANDPDFVDNFYEIIKHHKYSTTNSFSGSNIFYCVDLGLKVFIYANETKKGQIEGENFKDFSNISGYKSANEYTSSDYCMKNMCFFKNNLPIYPNVEMSLENIENFKNKLGLSNRTSNNVIRKTLLNYIKYGECNPSLNSKIKYFLLRKEKQGNKRTLVFFNTIKISYNKKDKNK